MFPDAGREKTQDSPHYKSEDEGGENVSDAARLQWIVRGVGIYYSFQVGVLASRLIRCGFE